MSELPRVPEWLDIPTGERALAMAMQFQLQQTQHASPEAVRALQLDMLRHLVAHAATHVPWYRERLGADFRLAGWGDWARIPVLSRAELQSSGTAMRSESLPTGQSVMRLLRTSGSTGRPVEVAVTLQTGLIHRAITHRDHLWRRRELGARLAIIRFDGTGRSADPGLRQSHWGDGSHVMFRNGPAFSIDSGTPTRRQLAWLREVGAQYLLTYPSLLPELAALNDRESQPLRLLGITSLGETLLPHQRERAEASFGCAVSDMYSAQETGYLALQCPRHAHYHVQSESCFLEVLDEAGKPCPPGVAGRVVVTPFHNLAQPLLRYEIGDWAVPGQPCDCGIRLPVLKQVLGRTRNLVLLPDGNRAWPAYNPMKLLDVIPGAQFQVVQESREDVLLRVAGPASVDEATSARVAEIVRTALGHPFRVRIECVGSIERSAGGKYEEFVCRAS